MLHRRNRQFVAISIASFITGFSLVIPVNADSSGNSYGPGLTVQDSSRRPVVIGRVLSTGFAERQTNRGEWVALRYNSAGYSVSDNAFEWVNDGSGCSGSWYLSPENGYGLPTTAKIISSETPSTVRTVKSGLLVYPAELKVITVHGVFIGPYPLTNPVCNELSASDRIAGTARAEILPTITLPIVIK